MTAIAPDERPRHVSLSQQLFSAVTAVDELPNGYRFRFGEKPELLPQLAEFIRVERLCCPFFGFTMEVEPDGGGIWLALTGREGIKPFITAEIGHYLSTNLVNIEPEGFE